MQMISIQESTNNHFDPLKSKWKETWIKIPWCDTQSWVAPRGRRGRSDIYIYIYIHIYIYNIFVRSLSDDFYGGDFEAARGDEKGI